MNTNVSIVSKNGQVVIPVKLRKKYGIKPGIKVVFCEKNGKIILRPVTKEYFEELAGWLKGEGGLLEELMKEKKQERKL